jgi:hypothetical protein
MDRRDQVIWWLLGHTKALIFNIKLKDATYLHPTKRIPNMDAGRYESRTWHFFFFNRPGIVLDTTFFQTPDSES